MRKTPQASGRRLAGILTVAIALSALHVATTQAQPTPAMASAAAPSAEGSGDQTAADQQRRVTLVTGDTVSYTRTGESYTVDVVEPRRSEGLAPSFTTQAGPDGVYVIPSDAWQLIQQGRVDKELFNVSYLAENGYADARSNTVPVILQYPERLDAQAVMTRARDLDESRLTATFGSIDAAAVRVDKPGADRLWDELVADATTREPSALTHGVQKLWLDRKMSLALDDSVPLVGAPRAWEAGYDGTGVTVAVLDGGIDATHPDVADNVAASASFVDGPPTDGFGHGTHVASTIAGSGAASDGRYKGMAPGADVVVGKVCSDSGQCPWSSVIAGMQWAAVEQDADIVSLSLGGCCSDGTDPAALAVNELTASTGALFVIAAGNDGPEDETVGTPGVADAALTVAATSKSDTLASFSSRGPRYLDGALKPEIAAPGVDITAARAAGTSMGSPVDDFYTSASGTSMATPHVSGAAALLKQKYPNWDADELKAALMSTVVDVNKTVYEVGAGRLDVGRAITQEVFANDPKLDYGLQQLGAEGDPPPSPVTQTVGYTNLSDASVTLQLTPSLARVGGASVVDSLTTPGSVTVPAHGSASVDVTLSFDSLGPGRYSGALVAEDTATDTLLTTPIGAVVEPKRYTLTVHTLGPDGQPLSPSGQDTIEVTGPGSRAEVTRLTDVGVTQTRVPAGTYSVAQSAEWIGADSRLSMGLLADPEVEVRADTEITLDIRTAEQTSYATPRPSSPINVPPAIGYQRTTTGDVAYASSIRPPTTQGSWTSLWAMPTEEVQTGGFRFWSQQQLGRPEVTMTALPDNEPIDLTAPMHGEYVILDPVGSRGLQQDFHPDWTPFEGTQDLTVVDAGNGAPEDLAGLDLHGKLALLEADAAFDNPFGGRICGLDVVAIQRVRVVGTPDTPYTYVLKAYEEGRIPSSLHYDLTPKQLGTVRLDYRAPRAATVYEDRTINKRDDQLVLPLQPNFAAPSFTGPMTRTEYFGPVASDVYQWRSAFARHGGLAADGYVNRVYRQTLAEPFVARPGDTRVVFGTPLAPGVDPGSEAIRAWGEVASRRGFGTCYLCRQGPYVFGYFRMATGGQDDFSDSSGDRTAGPDEGYGDFDIHLYRDGTEVVPIRVIPSRPIYVLPDQEAHYRMTAVGPQTDAEWTFDSARPTEDTRRAGYSCPPETFGLNTGPCAPLPMMFASYDLSDTIRGYDTVNATSTHQFDVFVYHGESTASWPTITESKVWTRVGDGPWTSAAVSLSGRDEVGNTTYTITAAYPKVDRDGAMVDLRVETRDAAGSHLIQTTDDAFKLEP
jgi:subtilisin family serine protease